LNNTPSSERNKLGIEFKSQHTILENSNACFLKAPKEAHQAARPDIELKNTNKSENDGQ